MLILSKTQSEMLSFLKDNGFVVIDNSYWNDLNIIMYKKGNDTFPFKLKDKYSFLAIFNICKDFGIEVPAEYEKARKQHNDLYKKNNKK